MSPLSFFTIPRPFRGHFDVIQRNAIRSWALLRPACEIMLLGDEEGTAAVAREYGVRHIPGIAVNEHAIPLLDDLFSKAREAAAHEWLCFVNADIILPGNFLHAFELTRKSMHSFLLIGRRWDLDVKELIDFGPEWEQKLKAELARAGRAGSPVGVDYFVFPRNLFMEVPPFAIGRVAYDNWLICRARKLRVPVIDATRFMVPVHQNHERVHTGPTAADSSPMSERNREMRRREVGMDYVFSPLDATHVVTSSGVRFAWRNLVRYLLWTVGFTWPVNRILAAGHKLALAAGISSRYRRARRKADRLRSRST